MYLTQNTNLRAFKLFNILMNKMVNMKKNLGKKNLEKKESIIIISINIFIQKSNTM